VRRGRVLFWLSRKSLPHLVVLPAGIQRVPAMNPLNAA
jgi:hypothetical protein